MNRKWVTIGVIAAAACAPQRLQGPPVTLPLMSRIDAVSIRGYTRFLSDDALAGRGTGTPEAEIAALYIQSACIGIGFAPITSRGYLQPVNLERTTIRSAGTNLRLAGPRGTRSFKYRDGFVPNIGL